jgi:hypothetical protein
VAISGIEGFFGEIFYLLNIGIDIKQQEKGLTFLLAP